MVYTQNKLRVVSVVSSCVTGLRLTDCPVRLLNYEKNIAVCLSGPVLLSSKLVMYAGPVHDVCLFQQNASRLALANRLLSIYLKKLTTTTEPLSQMVLNPSSQNVFFPSSVKVGVDKQKQKNQKGRRPSPSASLGARC